MFPVRAVKMPATLITQEKATHRWSAVVILKRCSGPVLQFSLRFTDRIICTVCSIHLVSVEALTRSEVLYDPWLFCGAPVKFYVKSALLYLKLNVK